MPVSILSFGFKYESDLPEADMRIDLRRRLKNPHGQLPKGAVGTDVAVRRAVMGSENNRRIFRGYLDRVTELLKENPDAVVAFGCKSGIHRSVVFAEELALRLQSDGHPVALRHLHLKVPGEGKGQAKPDRAEP